MSAAGGPGRLAVVSPHLDDAVLSCGELLATHPGASVITVFAGAPRDGDVLTGWDAACGFTSARQAMAERRAEDSAAMELLRARARWLEFRDSQYGAAPAVADVTVALHAVLRDTQADTVLVPFGLFHGDHDLAHRAALRALEEGGALQWLAYEDALYRRMPGLLQQRLARLALAHVSATPWACRAPRAALAKRRAVRCYASQLRGLGTPGRPGHADAYAPESYWRLTAAPR
jgi:LmbE family N-acetylglucosaminyl deacetylase